MSYKILFFCSRPDSIPFFGGSSLKLTQLQALRALLQEREINSKQL